MWKTKAWKLEEKEKMKEWVKSHEDRYIITEIFVDNGYAVEYKPFYVIKLDQENKMIKISEEERDSIVAVMQNKFEEFKVNGSWGLTDEMEDNYKEGVIDLLDSLVAVFGSYQSIYDISTLRDALEEKFEEMDGEE